MKVLKYWLHQHHHHHHHHHHHQEEDRNEENEANPRYGPNINVVVNISNGGGDGGDMLGAGSVFCFMSAP